MHAMLLAQQADEYNTVAAQSTANDMRTVRDFSFWWVAPITCVFAVHHAKCGRMRFFGRNAEENRPSPFVVLATPCSSDSFTT